MNNTQWVGLVAALAFPLLSGYGQTPQAATPGAPASAQVAAPANLSPGAAEVIRLASSGVGDDVVLAYVQNSQAPFNLSADDVLYLKDLGLSPQVTSAMLNHDSTLRNQSQQYAPAATVPVAPAPAAPAAPVPEAAAPAAAPAPAYVTSPPPDVTCFYNNLSPYGSWVNLEGYGWCWQPRVVVISPGWRPYCDGGYWVYSDVGWYWQSAYSWGWAPFHYGRWYAHPRCGWVWMPDRVWGPAWVTWRVAGDSCGWAPLPPHAEFDVRLGWRFNGVSVGASFDFGLGVNAFAFVAFGDFCDHDIRHHCLPPARVNTVYRQTTIVNNYVVNNNRIVNRGIAVERVSAASRTPVPRATVRDLPAGRTPAADRTGSVVYRHELQSPARPVNMVAQKVDAQHPVIQHAPITTARTARSSAFGSGASAPAGTARRPAVQTPKASSWSSGARPVTSPQIQSTPSAPRTAPAAPSGRAPQTSDWSTSTRTAAAAQIQSTPSAPQTTRVVPPAPAAPRAPEEWKQGTRTMPSYRSDAGLPALTPRTPVQSLSAASRTTSSAGKTSVYQPKGAHQAAELRSVSPSAERQGASPSSVENSAGSRSRRN